MKKLERDVKLNKKKQNSKTCLVSFIQLLQFTGGLKQYKSNLKFSRYIGEADFFGVKFLNFHIFKFFLGGGEGGHKMSIFLGMRMIVDIFGGHS